MKYGSNLSTKLSKSLPETDHNLIQGIIKGDERSYRLLFDEYYPSLTVFAKKYVGDLDTAREITQDVFVKIYESRHLLKSVQSLKGYLFTSVRNSCLNYIKLEKIHRKHEETIKRSAIETEDDYEQKLRQVELENMMLVAISELPDKCRLILSKSRFDGMKNSEIAEELNISIRTVETQISKALKRLREALIPIAKVFIISVFIKVIDAVTILFSS